jgi:hypothetical protein
MWTSVRSLLETSDTGVAWLDRKAATESVTTGLELGG